MNAYTDDEVFSLLRQIFDIQFSKKDLIQCKPEVIQKIYSMFLRDLYYSVEKFTQIPFSAPSDVHQYPQMYRTVLFTVTMAKCINHFMNMVYNDDEFHLMDAISPEWNRTKKFLIMFIEFYQFVCDHIPKFNEATEESDRKRQFYDEMKESIKMYKEKIQKKALENAEAEVELDKIIKSLNTESEEIEKLQEDKNRLKGRLEGLKEEIKELNIRFKEKELSILESKEKIQMLRSQVIDESECLEIDERKKKLDFFKETNEQLKKTLKEFKENLKLLEEKKDMLNNVLIPLVNEYEQEFKKQEELAAKLEDDEKEKVKLMEKYKDMSMSLQVLVEDVKRQEEESIQIKQRKDLSISGLRDEINQLRLTLEDIKRNNEEQEIVAKDLQSEIEKIIEDSKMLQEEYEDCQGMHNVEIENIMAEFLLVCREDLNKIKEAEEMLLKRP